MLLNQSDIQKLEAKLGEWKQTPDKLDKRIIASIEDILSKLSNKSIHVELISSPSRQNINLMSVYPTDAFDRIIEAIVNESKYNEILDIWKKAQFWTIEIDPIVFEYEFNFSDRELTALILHEVAHIIHSNALPVTISETIRMKYVTASIDDKGILKNKVFSKILSYPLLHLFNMSTSKADLNMEMKMDRYAVAAGYGKDLALVLNKVYNTLGGTNSKQEDISQLTDFSIRMIRDLKKRETRVLRSNSLIMLKHAPTNFAKKITAGITAIFGANKSTTMPVVEAVGVVSNDDTLKYFYERADKIINDVYMTEGFLTKKLKKFDRFNLDYIALEINNIKTNDDKMLLTSYIYSLTDTIEYYLSILESGTTKFIVPHSKMELMGFKQKLEKLRILCLNKKLPKIEYGININYPAGYEG